MSIKMSALAVALGTALGGSAFDAAAQTAGCALPFGNYALRLDVGTQCGSTATATFQNFLDRLKTNTADGLRSVVPSYNNTSVATANARFNGLPMSLTFPTTGSTVQFAIPALGYSRTFTGATRDDSIDQLGDDLKKGDILGRILAYQAANSPTSPITGFGGLMPTAIATDFNQNFTAFATNIAGPLQDALQPGGSTNLAGAALILGTFKTDSPDGMRNKVQVATLPLSYSFRNDIDPRRQLALSLPIATVDVNGAKTYALGFGMGYRFPINDNWTLVPSGRFSAVGSPDLATVSGVYTVGLTSVYMWDLGGLTVAMGNLVGYNSTVKLKSGEYTSDPKISNTSLRNGLLLSQPVVFDGRRLSAEYSVVDTRFVGGQKPFVDNYQEIGVTLGTNKNAFSARTFFRAGLTATFGKGTRGFSGNIGYWF